ncbi:hypothetical protein Pcinc_028838 [Petrolisthes cinctipes]|uniref:Uncharacterized protein n=1 Tax=Petrolisthes cinctipes TaxID=88211 RepID=A0AAE1F1K2_PETCI|nr:hypothetical protein Pcinc_028838 [Petrolisthes cinctipes]
MYTPTWPRYSKPCLSARSLAVCVGTRGFRRTRKELVKTWGCVAKPGGAAAMAIRARSSHTRPPLPPRGSGDETMPTPAAPTPPTPTLRPTPANVFLRLYSPGVPPNVCQR